MSANNSNGYSKPCGLCGKKSEENKNAYNNFCAECHYENKENLENINTHSLPLVGSSESAEPNVLEYVENIYNKTSQEGINPCVENGQTAESKPSSNTSITKTDKELYSDKTFHICEICKKTYCSAYSLRRHKLTHTRERTYVCQECKISFTRELYLKNHLDTHSAK